MRLGFTGISFTKFLFLNRIQFIHEILYSLTPPPNLKEIENNNSLNSGNLTLKMGDTAAAHGVVTAAGGQVFKSEGGELLYNTEDFLNPHLIVKSL